MEHVERIYSNSQSRPKAHLISMDPCFNTFRKQGGIQKSVVRGPRTAFSALWGNAILCNDSTEVVIHQVSPCIRWTEAGYRAVLPVAHGVLAPRAVGGREKTIAHNFYCSGGIFTLVIINVNFTVNPFNPIFPWQISLTS